MLFHIAQSNHFLIQSSARFPLCNKCLLRLHKRFKLRTASISPTLPSNMAACSMIRVARPATPYGKENASAVFRRSQSATMPPTAPSSSKALMGTPLRSDYVD